MASAMLFCFLQYKIKHHKDLKNFLINIESDIDGLIAFIRNSIHISKKWKKKFSIKKNGLNILKLN